MTDLAARLARFEDLEAARDVVLRYARVIDAGDPAALDTVFAADAQLAIPSGTRAGLAAIVDFYLTAAARDGERKMHFLSNVAPRWRASGRVEVDSYFLFTGTGAGASSLGWGTYHDRVTVADGDARITFKRIELRMKTDLAAGWPGVPTP